MKRVNPNIKLFLIFTLVSLNLGSSVVGQTSPARRVEGRILSSSSLPAIRIKFDRAFKYAGSQKFVLYDRAEAEQFFFVDADAERHIKRMYMVQFEGYLPNVDATYDYAPTGTVDLGGNTFIVNSEAVPNVSAVLARDPQSDAARAVAFLKAKGYSSLESVKFQRFVQVVGEGKRNEIILLYIEDAAGESKFKDEAAKKKFLKTAMKGFTILR